MELKGKWAEQCCLMSGHSCMIKQVKMTEWVELWESGRGCVVE